MPFTMAVSASLAPQLRSLKDDSSRKRDAVRLGVSFAIDVPILQ